jgi:calcium-dependent protein kinase
MKHAWLKEQKVGVDKDMKERRLSLHNSSRTGEFTKYLAMKKLKKAALGYIATNLTNDEVGKLEEIFRAMDTSGLGNISLTDLDDAISKGNFDQNIIDELRKLRTDFAISDKNTLNWKTFVAATMDKSMAMRADNMRLAFDHFKHTDADYLTLEDLVEIFEGEAPAREIMDLLDEDGDGEVTYEQFCHAVAQSMVEDEDEDDLEDFA